MFSVVIVESEVIREIFISRHTYSSNFDSIKCVYLWLSLYNAALNRILRNTRENIAFVWAKIPLPPPESSSKFPSFFVIINVRAVPGDSGGARGNTGVNATSIFPELGTH